MKKVLLFLFIYNLGFAQISNIQVKLVNPNVGSYIMGNNICSCGPSSNDAGLNQIFQTHNVTNYMSAASHPSYPGFEYNKLFLIECNNCNATQFSIDLNNYSSVIDQANISPQPFSFSDVVSFKLINSTIGNPTGYDSNGILTTNSSLLNQIFQNRNVIYYQGFSNNWYSTLICNCNVGELVSDLISNNFILPNTINIGGYSNYDNFYYSYNALLGNQTFNPVKTTISPNPFSDNFNIETENVISYYSLFDVSGKQIASTNSKQELDAKTQSLNAGFYILNLTFEDGANANYKLVKK